MDVDVRERLAAAKPLLFVEDSAQEVGGGDHALHNDLRLAAGDEFNGFEGRGGLSALFVDDFIVGEVHAEFVGDFFDFIGVADEECVRDSGLAGVLHRFHHFRVFGAGDADLLRSDFLGVFQKLIEITNLFHL